MRKLIVNIERNGSMVYAGEIIGANQSDASFLYAESYLADKASRPISISLPLQNSPYSPQETKDFFEGLLPEGFTRRSVANWMQVSENDYLSILAGLGKECMGALQIYEDGEKVDKAKYQELSLEEVHELAREGATKTAEIVTASHLSLTGASGKVGLYYDKKKDKWYLPLGSAASSHIVKQSHVRYKAIVANEQLSLRTAEKLGIEIPESFIIKLGSFADEDVLFATKRYDRYDLEGEKRLGRLHQEDFSQILSIPSEEKYEMPGQHYMADMFSVLRKNSERPIEDVQKMWDIITYHFLIGNTDGHIKNFSMLYSPDLKTKQLAPAYDIVSTVIYSGIRKNMSFSIGGEYAFEKIKRINFEKAANEIGLGKSMLMKRFDNMVDHFEQALIDSADELSDRGFAETKSIKEKILKSAGYKNL